MDIFEQHRVDFGRFNEDPSILFNPELVVKIGNRVRWHCVSGRPLFSHIAQIFPWSVAGPMLLSFVVYGKPLDHVVLAKLEASSRMLSPSSHRKDVDADTPSKPTAPSTLAAPAPVQESRWVRYKSWLWSSSRTTKERTDEDSNQYDAEAVRARVRVLTSICQVLH